MSGASGQSVHMVAVGAQTSAELTRYRARDHAARVLVVLFVAVNASDQYLWSIQKIIRTTSVYDISPGMNTGLHSQAVRHVIHMPEKIN
jgi:hypothetical protein